MTREGYNTHWLWKQWAREVTAARLAIAEGRHDIAEQALDCAEATSRVLEEAERWQSSELDSED